MEAQLDGAHVSPDSKANMSSVEAQQEGSQCTAEVPHVEAQHEGFQLPARMRDVELVVERTLLLLPLSLPAPLLLQLSVLLPLALPVPLPTPNALFNGWATCQQALGVGSNRQKQERAARLALAVAVFHQDPDCDWSESQSAGRRCSTMVSLRLTLPAALYVIPRRSRGSVSLF